MFLDFIKKNAKRNDSIGDFCGDTLRLLKMGKKPKGYSHADMHEFMFCNMDCNEAFEAFEEAWKEYANG